VASATEAASAKCAQALAESRCAETEARAGVLKSQRTLATRLNSEGGRVAGKAASPPAPLRQPAAAMAMADAAPEVEHEEVDAMDAMDAAKAASVLAAARIVGSGPLGGMHSEAAVTTLPVDEPEASQPIPTAAAKEPTAAEARKDAVSSSVGCSHGEGLRYMVKGLSSEMSPQRLLFHFPTAERVEAVVNTRTGARVCTSIVFGPDSSGIPLPNKAGVTLERVIHTIDPDGECKVVRWTRARPRAVPIRRR